MKNYENTTKLANKYICTLIMGLPGSGKSTIAIQLSKLINAYYIDSDRHHSLKNIHKMKAGIPLNDFDRKNWLTKILSDAQKINKSHVIIACSALKKKYREFLAPLNFKLVYLKIDKKTAKKRILSRKGHFMPVSLLESQISILEEPDESLIIDATIDQKEILNQIMKNIFKS